MYNLHKFIITIETLYNIQFFFKNTTLNQFIRCIQLSCDNHGALDFAFQPISNTQNIIHAVAITITLY